MYIKLGKKKFKLEYAIPHTEITTLSDEGPSTISIPANSLYYADGGQYVLYASHPTKPHIYFDDNIIENHPDIIQSFKEFMFHCVHEYNPEAELDAWLLNDLVEEYCNICAATPYSEGDEYDVAINVIHTYLYRLITISNEIFIDEDPKNGKICYADRDGQHFSIEDFADFLNLA